jgi:hypothetical protein
MPIQDQNQLVVESYPSLTGNETPLNINGEDG